MNIFDVNVIDGLRDMLEDDEALKANFLALKRQLYIERKQLSSNIEVKNWHHVSQLIRRIKVEAHQFGAIPLADKCREVEAGLHEGTGLTNGSLQGAEEILSLMQSAENFIDKKFVSQIW